MRKLGSTPTQNWDTIEAGAPEFTERTALNWSQTGDYLSADVGGFDLTVEEPRAGAFFWTLQDGDSVLATGNASSLDNAKADAEDAYAEFGH